MARKKVGKRKSVNKSVKLRPRRPRPVDRGVEGRPDLLHFEYEIDFDPIPDPDYDALPAEWRAEMQPVWEDSIEDFEAAIPILERGRERAPHIPRLWNLLAVAYQMTGRRDEAHELHDEAFRRFPDYLFARINVAHRFVESDEPERIREVLGEHLLPHEAAGGRRRFHSSEIIGFWMAVALYHVKVQNLAAAETVLAMLEDLDPLHPSVDVVRERIGWLRLLHGFQRIIEGKGRFSWRKKAASRSKAPPG
jgi:tetratricopeptide (TPR) repeat protein